MHKTLAVIILLGFLSKSYATTYFFSQSLGDDNRTAIEATRQDSPWKSIEILNRLKSTIKVGDTVLLKCGDTWFGSTFSPQINGLTIGSYGVGDNPVIDGGRVLAVKFGYLAREKIKVSKLTFRRSLSTGIIGQFGEAWSDAHPGMRMSLIENCIFEGGIEIQGSNNEFIRNIFEGSSNVGNGNGIWEHHKFSHHNTYRENRISNFKVRGIWSMIDTHESSFEHNIINNCTAAGIDLDGAYYVVYGHVVRGNYISNVANDAIELENAFDCLVLNNTLTQGGKAYIYIINYEKCSILNGHGAAMGIGAELNTKVIGNVMIGGGVDYTSSAIGIHRAAGVAIYNNTVVGFRSRFLDLDYAQSKEVRKVRLVNNIFSNMSVSSWYGMINFSTKELDVLEEDDYNCFYNNGKNDIYSNREDHKQLSLQDYNRLNPSKARHSISMDPGFESKDNLKLRLESPCRNMGKDVGVVFLGDAPDIGAFINDKEIIYENNLTILPMRREQSKRSVAPTYLHTQAVLITNPVRANLVRLKLINFLGAVKVTVFDIKGCVQLVSQMGITNKEQIEFIDMGKSLPKGLYVIQLESGSKGVHFLKTLIL